MAASRNTRLALIALGAGLATAGAVYLHRTSGSSLGLSGLGFGRPKGRLVKGRAKEAPVVETFTEGGMTVTHRRSANMSIEQRVASIQDMVAKSIMVPSMRKLALGITNKCKERDEVCEAKAIYDAVRARIRYNGDIAPVKMGSKGPVEAIDMYHRADRTWEMGAADCDDQSILTATLLALNGIESRLRVTAEKGQDWGHIYTVALLPKGAPTKSFAIDTTLPGNRNFGREVPYDRHLDFHA